jgi:hypothetical protein
MPRAIDHLVLCVDDLKKARAAYQAMGFTMTPPAQHPFGTGNVIAQLSSGCFLEVLAVTRPDDIPPQTEGAFNFASVNREFVARRQGMSMLVLRSEDEVADREDFMAKGLNVYAPFEFQRQATLPDGSEATVGFSLTFVDDPALPGLGFFTCKHWRPDLFWKPDYQRHENGARTLGRVLMIAPDPGPPAGFLAAFSDSTAMAGDIGSVTIDTACGNLSIMTPDAFQDRFPDAVDPEQVTTPVFAGYEITVDDIEATEAKWTANGLTPKRGPDGPWLGPDQGLGCVIAACQTNS